MLEIKGVHAGYGNLKILRGIDMEVPSGGIVTLLGGNGTGKSTLLKAISGLIPLMEGEVIFDGVSVSKLKPHERMRLGLVQVSAKILRRDSRAAGLKVSAQAVPWECNQCGEAAVTRGPLPQLVGFTDIGLDGAANRV